MMTLTLHGELPAVTCEAILFDMDGTLVDSTGCVEQTWRVWAARHGLDAAAVIADSHGMQNHETIRRFAPHLETPEELAFLVRAEEDCRDGLKAVPGAVALLASLPSSRWAVVTSAWTRLAQIRMGAAGLPAPSVLVTADHVQHSKPHPQGYLTAAARLGLAPAACVVIEDAPAGIEAANRAGMRVIGITTTFPRERLDCALCIPDFHALRVSVAGSALTPASSS